jgi:hypothetical protein
MFTKKTKKKNIFEFLFFREMTKAVMTAQPGGTSTTINTRQQATEADAIDERVKPSKQVGVISDHSPFTPRRSMPKSLDRNTRRSATVTQPVNTTDKDISTSKKQQPRGPLTATQTAPLTDFSQRVKRSTPVEPLTPTSKIMGKEDSPASVSHSDSGKPKNGTIPSSTQNRSYQSKANVDETPSPAIIMYTSTSGIEHGKPPKTPRSARATTSRSDAIAPTRQITTRGGDSEAISVPAATFAIKAGPQTVMSQWIISLNDNLDDEGSDNQHSAKWEDAHEKLQRLEKDFILFVFPFFFSTTHEPSQYHPASAPPPPPASSSPPPLVNNPLTPSNTNSQQITTTAVVNNLRITSPVTTTPITYATILNSNSSGLGTATNNNVLTATTTSIINGGRQQQYHRPLLRGVDENSNAGGTLNSYDGKENKRKSFKEYKK